MDTAQWPEQGIGVVKVVPMEGNNNSPGAVAVNNNTKAISAAAAPRPQKPQALNCPRCNSAHTKFCYYNNYSLSQPRYFCKTCRRYWTEGGSLRNVPVGGGSRKNKRSSSSSNPTIAASSSSSLSKNIKLPHEIITSNSQNPNSKIIYHDQGQDLNLAYPPTGPSTYNSTATGISEFVEFPSATSSHHHHHQFSQLLKSGIGGRGSFTSFMSMIPVSDSSNNNSAAIYSSSSGGAGLPFQEFSKPITSGVNFSLDQQHGFESNGGGGVYGSLQLGVHQESSGSNNHAKLFNFPFEDLKQQPVLNSSTTSTQDPELMDQQSRGTTVTTTNTTQGDHHHHHHHHHRHQSPAGYWNNINGGGSW